MVLDYFIFLFKQKTAYEMRISDWSSDVCSSDLQERREHVLRQGLRRLHRIGPARIAGVEHAGLSHGETPAEGGQVERRLAQSLHPAADPEILVERRYAGLRIAQLGHDLLPHGDQPRLILPETQLRRGRLGRRRAAPTPHPFPPG